MTTESLEPEVRGLRSFAALTARWDARAVDGWEPHTATRRAPTDIVRFVSGLAVLAWASVAVGSGDPSQLEQHLFRIVNQLPATAGPPLIAAMQFGALASVPLIAVVCVLSRRLRLAGMIACAGAGAWMVATLLGAVVAQHAPDEQISGVVLHGGITPGLAFPSTHVAVAAAIATVASPHLRRWVRWCGWLIVLVVAVARIYVGAHLPIDVVGGAALGLLIGSAVHLLAGAPRGLPRPEAVARRLAAEDVPVSTVESWMPASGSFRAATTTGGLLHVRVVDRGHRRADWPARAWRLLAYRRRRGGDPRRIDHSVEHEALAFRLAAEAGVRVPEVRATVRLSPGETALVREWVPGNALIAIGDASTLRAAWDAIAALHRAGMAHGAANLHSFIGVDREVCCVGLAHAHADASVADKNRDVAELLAASSAIVDPATAVQVAVDAVGSTAVLEALPGLQPLALSRETWTTLRGSNKLVELREHVGALGNDPLSPLELPLRIAVRNLAPLFFGTAAFMLLLTRAGSFRAALHAAGNADPAMLALAAGAAVGVYFMAALALIGASPQPLAFRRTVLVQLGAAFTNKIAPAGIGGMVTNVRYLERAGIRRGDSIRAVGLNAAAGFVVHVAILALVVSLTGSQSSVRFPAAPDLGDYVGIALAVVGCFAIAGLWYWRHRLGRALARLRPHVQDLRVLAKQPRRALLLFGGSFGVAVAHAFILVFTLAALGATVPLVTVLAVFFVGTALAAAAPTPGGLGAVEAALVAGLAHAGTPTTLAVAAVLTARLLGYWLPILPGWFAFATCTRRGIL